MAIEELTQPLDFLEANDNNEGIIVAWFQKTRTACSDMLGTNDIILELKQTQEADHQGEKTPHHRILLAYAHHHLGDTDTAIKFSDMSVRYFNNRGMEWHQSMSHWFLGILLCKQGELDKAEIEIDHAVNILVKLEKEDEQLGNYRNKYKEQINAIKESLANTTIKITTAGCSLLGGEIIVPDEVFSGIIDRIKIDKDNFLNGLWREIRELNSLDIAQVDARFDRLDSMLKEKKENRKKNEKRIVTNPYLNIFLAHCYNFRSCKKESQYPLALQFAWNAIKEFQSTTSSYSHKLNKHNHALSRWYLGLLYRSRDDHSSYSIQLKKSKHLFFELQQLYDENEVSEIEIIQDCLDMPESSRIWPESLLNRPEIQKPDSNQETPFHWLGLEYTSKTPPHNRRASDLNQPDDTPKAPVAMSPEER